MPKRKKGQGDLVTAAPVFGAKSTRQKNGGLDVDSQTNSKVEGFFSSENLDSIVAHGRLWELLGAVFALGDSRQSRYKDYGEMLKDTIMLSAAELMTEDATQADPDKGRTLWPDENSPYAKDIEEFLDYFEIEDRYPGWMWKTITEGDFFLRVRAEPGKGITQIYEDSDPSQMYRVEIEGKLEGFIEKRTNSSWNVQGFGGPQVNQIGGAGQKQKIYKPWECVHFMLNYRPYLEKIKLKVPTPEGEQPDNPDGTKNLEITSTYGTSVFENARFSYKILKLLEMVIIMGRLSRSALIRMFYLNTDGMTPKERRDAIDTLKRKLEKKDAVKLDGENLFKTEFNPLSFNDTFVIPTSGGRGDIRAENLGGDLNLKDLVDLDYWNNRVFAGIRIPKAFLGFEDSLPGSMGSTTLTRLDIRYARGAKKNQKAGLQGLARLLAIHIAFKHQIHPKKEEVMLHCAPISGAEEMERFDALSTKINLAANILQSLTNLPQINAVPLIKYVFDKILQLDGAMADDVIQDPPAEEEGGGGGFGGRSRRFASTEAPDAELMLETMKNMSEDELKGFLFALASRRRHERVTGGRDFSAPLPDFEEE